MTDETRTLLVSWSVSRGRDTYGYNICRLDDMTTDKRYRCMGGGYDMLGTVFGEWLQDVYQDRLQDVSDRAHHVYVNTSPFVVTNDDANNLYGMAVRKDGYVMLDGACGIESMLRIAEAVGIGVRSIVNRKGHVVGFTVSGVAS